MDLIFAEKLQVWHQELSFLEPFKINLLTWGNIVP